MTEQLCTNCRCGVPVGCRNPDIQHGDIKYVRDKEGNILKDKNGVVKLTCHRWQEVLPDDPW